MSGPKGYHWIVLSAPELIHQEAMRTRARCLALRDKLAGQLAVLSENLTVPVAPAGESLAEMRAWESALTEANTHATQLTEASRARHHLALAANTVGAALQIPLALGLGERQANTADAALNVTVTTAPSGEPTVDPRVELATRLQRALITASGLEDPELIEAVAGRARDLANAGPRPDTEAQLLIFEASITDQLKAQARRNGIRAEAERIVLRIAHMDGPAVESLRQMAGGAATPAALESLRSQVTDWLEAERVQAETDYTSQCLAQILTEMGYQVGGPLQAIGQPSSPPNTRHMFDAQRADLPGHFLRLQVSDQGKFFSRVFASNHAPGPSGPSAELATCADVMNLPVALAARGIEAKLEFARQPGTVDTHGAAQATAQPGGQKRKAGARHRPSEALEQSQEMP
ncbi:MAG: hypothetical protein LBJ02_00490 [Bifidobacteriaceae bacterium]|jgi:hypothetical protein|nr:hypothetical protein [Bifidobacteriaceae bacterium]